MKLTTKGRYAVMAMADLALFRDKGPVSLTEDTSSSHTVVVIIKGSSGGCAKLVKPISNKREVNKYFIKICSL